MFLLRITVRSVPCMCSQAQEGICNTHACARAHVGLKVPPQTSEEPGEQSAAFCRDTGTAGSRAGGKGSCSPLSNERNEMQEPEPAKGGRLVSSTTAAVRHSHPGVHGCRSSHCSHNTRCFHLKAQVSLSLMKAVLEDPSGRCRLSQGGTCARVPGLAGNKAELAQN